MCDQVRRLIHVLHAARHRDIDIAEQDLLRCRNDGLGARAANAVHRHRRDRHRQPGVDCSLASGIHLGARLDHVPHDDGADLARLETGTFDAGADREGAEIGRGHVFETAAERADGGANRSDENDRVRCTHGGTSWVRSRPARPIRGPGAGRAACRSARPLTMSAVART